jgi:hypothetical protein
MNGVLARQVVLGSEIKNMGELPDQVRDESGDGVAQSGRRIGRIELRRP